MSYKYVNNTRTVQQIVDADGHSIWLFSGKTLELEKEAKHVPNGVDQKSAPKESKEKE